MPELALDDDQGPPHPHDDTVLRRTIGRIGLLDRTAVFDDDEALHDRIETILARLGSPSPPGPPREDLLAHLAAVTPVDAASA